MFRAVHTWMSRVETDDGQALSFSKLNSYSLLLNCWLRWPGGNVPGECEHVFDQTRDCIVFVQHESWAELQCWQRLLRHDFTCYTHQPCQEDARLRGCCLIGNFDKYIDRLGRTPQFLSPGPCGLSSEILRSYFIWVFGGEIKCIFPSACDTAPAPLSLPGLEWWGLKCDGLTDADQETVLEPALHINYQPGYAVLIWTALFGGHLPVTQ